MEKKKSEIKRAISVTNLLNYNPRTMDFKGKWLDSFGRPELGGCWIIWGASGNGKTRLALQLAKYMTAFGRVVYNSLEEGLSLSFKRAVIDSGIVSVKNRFTMLDKEPIEELIKRLEARKSADIIFIDSIQYSGLNKDTAKKLVDSHRSKLFVFVSHAEGSNPSGRTAKSIRFHSDVKLFVTGFRIPEPVSRFKEGGCSPFVIWEEGAENYEI